MNIYVGNLPLEITEEELQKEFLVFGHVASVNIMNDRDISSGQPCGYGFIEMPQEFEGKAALSGLKGKIIKGRLITVIEGLCVSKNTPGKALDTRRGSRFNRMKQRDVRNKSSHFP